MNIHRILVIHDGDQEIINEEDSGIEWWFWNYKESLSEKLCGMDFQGLIIEAPIEDDWEFMWIQNRMRWRNEHIQNHSRKRGRIHTRSYMQDKSY